ncbi:hypothetical protein BU068_12135, partial [Staphylococcus succinus]|uniref:hypothetical protein n=1 Tax=Staphylococcus succinus TaxID=61015 RepID=UPI000FF7DA4B
MFKKMSFSIITFILTFSLFITFTANAEEDNKKQGNLGGYVDEITNIHEYTSKLGFKLSDDNIKYDISEALIDRDFYTVTIVD